MKTFEKYADAIAWMHRNPGSLATWSGGMGWTCVGYYDAKKRRNVIRSTNEKGGEC